MKRPSWLAVVIALNLVALAVLVFVFPHLMVSPGAVMPGHAGIAKDCFACHQPWRGAAANLCIDCHRTADIGIRTTKGAPMPAKAASSSTSTIQHSVARVGARSTWFAFGAVASSSSEPLSLTRRHCVMTP